MPDIFGIQLSRLDKFNGRIDQGMHHDDVVNDSIYINFIYT